MLPALSEFATKALAAKSITPDNFRTWQTAVCFTQQLSGNLSLACCAHCERCERHPAQRAERGQAHDDRSAHGGRYLLQQVLANCRMEICEPCP